MSRVVAASIAMALTACTLGELVQAPTPSMPTLVVEVSNRSNSDVGVGYLFEASSGSGGGESLSRSCRREALPLGPIAGQYRIFVDGKRVTSGGLGKELPEEAGFLVIRLTIHENGGVEVGASPDLKEQAPEANSPIPSCEEG